MAVQHALAASLARNLARLCERDESIAAVCRATGINRQQFSRYLAGQSVPSPKNRRKICKHFEISETDLFRGPDLVRGSTEVAGAPPGQKAPWSHAEFGPVLKLIYSETRPSISPGLYFVHFLVPREKNSVVRSTLAVRNDGSLMTFRRLTGLSERKTSWWGQFLGDHRGVVMERAHWLYFVGLNAVGVREPTLMVLRWLSGARPMLGGQALVNGPAGPTPLAVIVTPCLPSVSLRAAIRSSHAYTADDPVLEPLIVEALEEQAKTIAAKTRRLDLRVRRRHLSPIA